jgi:serine/threonine protein kinase
LTPGGDDLMWLLTTSSGSLPRLPECRVKVGREIGSGGSAVVTRILNNEHLVMKRYHKNISEHKVVQRELAILRSLEHAYIVPVYAAIVNTAETLVIGFLMEALDDNLAHINSLLTDVQRLTVLSQVAEALMFTHSQDITHGDVKPENVLVNHRNGRVVAKLCDFDVAKVRNTLVSTTSSAGGTCLYAAPEGVQTAAADAFSFGMMLWVVFSPLDADHTLGGNPTAITTAILQGKRPPDTLLSRLPTLQKLMTQCWDRDPLRRPSMEECVRTLRGILAELTLHGNERAGAASPEAPLRHSGRPTEVQPWPLRQLNWQRPEHSACRISDALPDGHAIRTAVEAMITCREPLSVQHAIRSIRLVYHDQRDIFWRTHRYNSEMLVNHSQLRAEVRQDPAGVAALRVLDRFFDDSAACLSEMVRVPLDCRRLPRSKLVLAWHGTPQGNLMSVCSGGPQPLRTTDGGYFGVGSYFALEAACAIRYCRAQREPTATLLLFACSVSQVYPVTLERDYPLDVADPARFGRSRFFASPGSVGAALEPRHDAHFIPVREYQFNHPVTGALLPLGNYLDYQAATAGHPTHPPRFHELVVTPARCTPIALVEFETR